MQDDAEWIASRYGIGKPPRGAWYLSTYGTQWLLDDRKTRVIVASVEVMIGDDNPRSMGVIGVDTTAERRRLRERRASLNEWMLEAEAVLDRVGRSFNKVGDSNDGEELPG